MARGKSTTAIERAAEVLVEEIRNREPMEKHLAEGEEKAPNVHAVKIGTETCYFTSTDIADFNKLFNIAKKSFNSLNPGLLKAAFALYEIDRKELFKIRSYKNIAAFAKGAFALSKSQTYNYIHVVKYFGDCQEDNSCEALKKEFEAYSITNLIEMVPIAKKCPERLAEFTPSLSVNATKVKTKSILREMDANRENNPIDPASEEQLPSEGNSEPEKKKSNLADEKFEHGKLILEVKSTSNIKKAHSILDQMEERLIRETEAGGITCKLQLIIIPLKEEQ